MSLYWKQSLIIGGIYWLFSLILVWQGSWEALIADCIISVLLLLFLIPLNLLVPIKRIDNMMVKHPIVASILASVGWIPYLIAVTVIIASTVVLINMEYMEKVMTIVVGLEILRKFLAAIIVFTVLIAVLVYGKSIAGQLDDNYEVITFQKSKANNVLENKQNVVNAKKIEKKTTVKQEIKTTEKKKTTAKKSTAKKAITPKSTAKKTVAKKSVKAKNTAKKTVAKSTKVKKTTARKSHN